MSRQIYISGKFFPQEDAKISVFDHGLLYGDGVFEGLRSYRGKVFRLNEHIRRLYESAKAIWLEIPMQPDEMSECSGDNIFLVRQGALQTQPLEAGILEGVTRDTVIEVATEAGIDVREMPLTKHDVYIADECFLTGTAAEVVPVVRVDNRVIG